MKNTISSAKKQKLIFYISMAVIPVAQFLIFYLYINIRSFTMGFQSFDRATGTFYFSGLINFIEVINDLKTLPEMLSSIRNSLELFFWTFVFGSLLAVFFSYYIYKKRLFSGFFKIILYTPHIISGLIFVMLYKYFVDNAIPEIVNKLFSIKMSPPLNDDSQPERIRFLIIFFSIWISFGTKVLMYTGAMSGISESVIESGKLDGITPMKELVFIVVPLIWSTFVTFMVVSVAGIFTNEMSLMSFYGTEAPPYLYTFGYYLYKEVLKATTMVDYPYLSAMGLLLTVIAVPLTLFVKWALDKFGPKTV